MLQCQLLVYLLTYKIYFNAILKLISIITNKKYPKYDNYNAINIDKVSEIPLNYQGVMGVPISFLTVYNPQQFEIVGLAGKDGFGLHSNRFYNNYKEMYNNGLPTGANGSKINGNPILLGKSKKDHYFINEKGRIVHALYGRIFIKNKHLKNVN